MISVQKEKKMSLLEQHMRKQLERSKVDAADRAARQYAATLSQKYLSEANRTTGRPVNVGPVSTESLRPARQEEKVLSLSTESVSVSPTPAPSPYPTPVSTSPLPVTSTETGSEERMKEAKEKSQKGRDEKEYSTEQEYLLQGILADPVKTSTVVLSDRMMKTVDSKTRKEKADAEYSAEMKYLASSTTARPVQTQPELSTISLVSMSPPLATLPVKSYPVLSVQQTGVGSMLMINLSTWEGVLGLVGFIGAGRVSP